jgi:hypothetical protein
MCSSLHIVLSYPEYNQRIFIEEDEAWAVKGRYNSAIKLYEKVEWEKDGEGKSFLRVLAVSIPIVSCHVSHGYLQEDDEIPATATASNPPNPVPAPQPPAAASDDLRQQIMSLLNIPAHLAVRSSNTDVRTSYMKYQEYLRARSVMLEMIAAGTWTLPTLTNDKLIEIFVSKSTWHSRYSKLFPQVQAYPRLVAWLEHAPDAVSDAALFGVAKQTYMFQDLEGLLEDLKKEKLKRKGRESGEVNSSKRDKKSSSSKGKQRV